MEYLAIDTPEAVEIDYDVAGIGTRLFAAIIDLFFIFCWGLTLLLVCGIVAVTGSVGQQVAVILGLSGFFLLFWGYFAIFETIWSGQTPGKRSLHIRVLTTDGYPIGFGQAALRNVVRIIDYLPSGFGFGLLAMFIDRRSRRLGDLVAGTVVVRDRVPIALADAIAGVRPVRLHRTRTVLRSPIHDPPPVQIAVTPPRGEELGWRIGALDGRLPAIARDFLARAPDLPPEVRARIGARLADEVASRIGAPTPADAVVFLRRVLELYDGQGTAVRR